MRLMDLFRPKWKHPRWEVRKAAVEKVTDQTVLKEIAKTDKISCVRWKAVDKLTDQEVVAEIAQNDKDEYVREVAVRRLTNQKLFAKIAKNDKDRNVRKAALCRITDQVYLDKIYKDGTITDDETRLMWQRMDDGIKRSFDDAREYCKNLSLAEKDDWRLPDNKELKTLFQSGSSNNHLPHFKNAKEERYWTAEEYFSSREPDRKFAYVVDFKDGNSITYYQEYEYYVRAVRYVWPKMKSKPDVERVIDQFDRRASVKGEALRNVLTEELEITPARNAFQYFKQFPNTREGNLNTTLTALMNSLMSDAESSSGKFVVNIDRGYGIPIEKYHGYDTVEGIRLMVGVHTYSSHQIVRVGKNTFLMFVHNNKDF